MKTADGVEMFDGMTIFVPCPFLAHSERADLKNGTFVSGYAGTVFPGGVIDPAIAYSTPEAARDAWDKMQA